LEDQTVAESKSFVVQNTVVQIFLALVEEAVIIIKMQSYHPAAIVFITRMVFEPGSIAVKVPTVMVVTAIDELPSLI
jgi:hypothetical protein